MKQTFEFGPINKKITLSKPRHKLDKTIFMLAMGRCKSRSYYENPTRTITYYPRINLKSVKQARRFLDALKAPKSVKIEHLELMLGDLLGTHVFLPKYDHLAPLKECYDFVYGVQGRYISNQATILTPKGELKFSIDFPVGHLAGTDATPTCCKDKEETWIKQSSTRELDEDAELDVGRRALIGADEAEKKAEEKRKKEEDEIDKAMEEMGDDKPLFWKPGLDPKFKFDPDWGLKFDYEKADKDTDTPVLRIKPKYKF